jgi:hypothetical protein
MRTHARTYIHERHDQPPPLPSLSHPHPHPPPPHTHTPQKGATNTLILRMYKPDPSLNDTLRIDEIEPPVLYVGNTLNDGRRCVRACVRVGPSVLGSGVVGFVLWVLYMVEGREGSMIGERSGACVGAVFSDRVSCLDERMDH